MAKILITGAIQPSEWFEKEIVMLDYGIQFVQNELESLSFDTSDVEVVICNGLFLYNDISKFPSLRYIQVTSAGLDRLPMEQIEKRGVVIENARGVYSIPMAEWALAAILSLYKNMSLFMRNQMQHRWVKNREVRELSDSRALIIGLGSVGQQVAQRLWAMGVMVDGVDRESMVVKYVERCYSIYDLRSIIGNYDIVVLTLPLTADTYHIVNADILDALKYDSILINISRGAIIDESALIETLQNGKIRGAALDVFESEPLGSDSPLWSMNNVIITPHNSFVSERNKDRLEGVIIDNLKRYHERQ